MTSPDPLAPLRAHRARTVVVSDFDGSLAPIVPDPRDARPLPEVIEVLAGLSERFGGVAVVSGRPVSFLRRVLPVEGLGLFGLYGMERVVEGEVVLSPAAAPYAGTAERIAAEAERLLPGLYVERKGEVCCVLHWRREPEMEEEAVRVATELARAHGMATERARMAIEVRPPVHIDKGTAVEELVDGCAAALFAGDDVGDLRAFEALDRLERSGRLGSGVRVAVLSSEAPPELVARADERVEGPAELVALLRGLLGP